MNNIKSGIYMWTSTSGKSYIGQATDLVRRYNAFLRFDKHYAGDKIDNARSKYNNADEWTYVVLERCDIDALDEREKYYIALYDTMNNGYNCESGGNGKKIVSDSSKQKNREAHLGLYDGENNPNYGKKHTQEVKNFIGDLNSVAILQLTKDGVYVNQFKSIKDAAQSVGVTSSAIWNCLNGKCRVKSVKGYKWRYKKESD